jgi:hypothetical protein
MRVSNRDRFLALEAVLSELLAAGCVLDITQLDWAVKEVEDRLREADLDRQFELEAARVSQHVKNVGAAFEDGYARGLQR